MLSCLADKGRWLTECFSAASMSASIESIGDMLPQECVPLGRVPSTAVNEPKSTDGFFDPEMGESISPI
jgi:hypothetical protein